MELRKFVHKEDPSKVIEVIADTHLGDVQAQAILSFENEDGDKLYKEVKEKKSK